MFRFQSKTNHSPSVYPVAKTDNLVIQETNDELLVYNLESNKAICLNQTASVIWKSCDGKTDISEIINKLEKEFNSSVDENLVWFALEQLTKEGLLANKENLPDKFSGLSRREVIKKVGFSSMIALPIISSVIAPQAVHAQSGCVNPGGVLPGGMADTCFAPGSSFCQTMCNNNCCSGMGTLGNPPGGPCNTTVSGCTCTCN